MEFFLRKFLVDERALIPRLETESLVRKALKRLREISVDTIVDVWCGSGIIAVTAKKELPNLAVIAVDISLDALELAKTNAQKQNANIDFLQSDLLGIFLNGTKSLGKNICIITNLPYIKAEDWENMSEDTKFEPKNALFGGEETGFELYEKFFTQVQTYAEKYQPNRLEVFAEFGYDQKEICAEVLKKYGWNHEFFADLSGVERFVWVKAS